MPTVNLAIGDEIDAADALSDFSKKCESLNIADRQQIVQDIEDIAYDLERRGKELASLGSQFRTAKVLKHQNCNVRITASYGIPSNTSPLTWLRSLLQRR